PEPNPSPTVEPTLSGRITVAGSTTVQPLAEKLATAFRAANPNVEIIIQGGGSSVGVKSAAQGIVDFGAASRELKDSERAEFPDLVVHRIAIDGVAIVVHPDVPVDNITTEQVRAVFAGDITNWRELGGPDRPITVVAREEGSGTRDFFQEHFMKDREILARAILQPSNGALRTAVSTTPNSIGFLSFGYLDDSVKALAVDGVQPTEANVYAGTYTAWRYLNMLTRGEPAGLARAWLEFILSDDGQQIVTAQGYLAVKR
ncbi:MAG: phosphate ABC transporter substrate-binding protein, partial [Anaerolineae bacterium]|nr:phosphate ABC transporter substrate-binding protein [Anaerolineae bacterium]